MFEIPSTVIGLLTRARIRIVKRTLGKRPPEVVPQAVNCGLDCPGSEEMAAYIDRKLPWCRKAAMDEHLCFCPACFRLYVEVLHYQLEQEEIA